MTNILRDCFSTFYQKIKPVFSEGNLHPVDNITPTEDNKFKTNVYFWYRDPITGFTIQMIYLVLNAKNDNNQSYSNWNVTYPRTFSGNYGLLSTFRANEVILSSWTNVRMVLRPNTSVSNNSETHTGYVFLFGIC